MRKKVYAPPPPFSAPSYATSTAIGIRISQHIHKTVHIHFSSLLENHMSRRIKCTRYTRDRHVIHHNEHAVHQDSTEHHCCLILYFSHYITVAKRYCGTIYVRRVRYNVSVNGVFTLTRKTERIDCMKMSISFCVYIFF